MQNVKIGKKDVRVDEKSTTLAQFFESGLINVLNRKGR